MFKHVQEASVLQQGGPSSEIALKLRIPGWAVSEGVSVRVNEEDWAVCSNSAGPQAGSFCTVHRSFSPGASHEMPPALLL